MLRQRNYCLATWDPSLENHRQVRVPSCFAFFGIRSTREAAEELGAKLNLEPAPWMIKDHWAVAWDYVVGQGYDPFKEIHMRLWEMSSLGIGFSWCEDLIPEMPKASRGINNCYPTFEEALEAFALISPSSNPDLRL